MEYVISANFPELQKLVEMDFEPWSLPFLHIHHCKQQSVLNAYQVHLSLSAVMCPPGMKRQFPKQEGSKYISRNPVSEQWQDNQASNPLDITFAMLERNLIEPGSVLSLGTDQNSCLRGRGFRGGTQFWTRILRGVIRIDFLGVGVLKSGQLFSLGCTSFLPADRSLIEPTERTLWKRWTLDLCFGMESDALCQHRKGQFVMAECTLSPFQSKTQVQSPSFP